MKKIKKIKSQNSSNSSTGASNTEKQPPPLKYWCFTWNNHTDENWKEISSIVPKYCDKWIYQEEIGEKEHTPHIQGWLSFKQKTRLTAVIKLFTKHIHWEPSRSIASNNYCKKASFEGARRCQFPEPIKTFRPNTWWADEIEALIKTEPDHRTIHWYWEPIGNIGKSAFTKYLHINYGIVAITSCKSADIITAIDDTIKCIVFDFPRCAEAGTFCPFNAIEQIKNGFITDGKLKKQARIVCFNSPHVIIFANEPPNKLKLSADRWHITEITPEPRGTLALRSV